MTRAAQDNTGSAGPPEIDHKIALAIQVHGDAVFPGQRVAAETLHMLQIDGYRIGGSIHLIVNNQIGFTTLPEDGRSTRHASDLAKGFDIPVVHVNADDTQACLVVAKLAFAYRERYHKDFVIDTIGYRRWGHNEGDEPTYTQPRMYDVIRSLPTVRELWAKQLVGEGTLSRADADAMLDAAMAELAKVHREVRSDAAAIPAAAPVRLTGQDA